MPASYVIAWIRASRQGIGAVVLNSERPHHFEAQQGFAPASRRGCHLGQEIPCEAVLAIGSLTSPRHRMMETRRAKEDPPLRPEQVISAGLPQDLRGVSHVLGYGERVSIS
jgi:hypothetical protein